MTSSSRTLADKLKALMPARGLDQAGLARQSGIKANSISRYLGGLNRPRPAQLAKLATALQVDIGDLLADEPAAAPATAGNLLCLTQTSATPAMVRLQIDQLLPGELATRVVALLLQSSHAPEAERASTMVAEALKPSTARPPSQTQRGTLADILLPHPPHAPEHARQVLRLDGPPRRTLNDDSHARGESDVLR